MTEKLYYQDSHRRSCSAVVLACQPGAHGYDIILDRTVFYPEGGGQPGDQGLLGGVRVCDTREQGAEIVHRCDGPLAVGAAVEAQIDWPRRFRFMQQHSGEHILSGLIHAAYGWNNVGFHMGHDAVTIDFDGPIPEADLPQLERRVNEIIWENRPVEISYPTAAELAAIPYRSKKELTGQVRIVTFPGADVCACCGTHVCCTGEIGLLKILSCQKFHQGVRLEILCGGPAMELLTQVYDQNRQVSGLLSARPLETGAVTAKFVQDLNDAKYRQGQLEEQLFRAKAQALTGQGDVLLFEEGLRPDALRRLTDAVQKTCGGRAAIFSRAETGYHYAMGQTGGDLRALTRAMNTALQGRGGGKPFFVQGSVQAAEAQIRKFFETI